VFFRMGSYSQDTGWVLGGKDIAAAEKECERLNAENKEIDRKEEDISDE